MMEHLFQTFLHSIAWHSGTKLVHTLGLPVVVVFVLYGVYKLIKQRKIM